MAADKSGFWVISRWFTTNCPRCQAPLAVHFELTFPNKIPDPINAQMTIQFDKYQSGGAIFDLILASDQAQRALQKLSPSIEVVRDALSEILQINADVVDKMLKEGGKTIQAEDPE